ncbi:MAG: type I DNA topoisomerase [Alphaproteobacteria bacterium]
MGAANVVIVESPAKAKTINKYLGDGYEVLASFGHIRDLPPKDGSVRPDDDFSMSWEVDGRSKKRMDDIAKAIKGADNLILATDPDREGEAISWHVQEELARRKALNGLNVSRVVFHEITKRAVLEAMAHPRDLNRELIDAYLARRALDYLVGFTLSPVLWRKLPGAKSAGRVQSVALRLICEREAEIEAFRAEEYWSVEAGMTTTRGDAFSARLIHLDGAKLDKFTLGNEAKAQAAVATAQAKRYDVRQIERKTQNRNPAPPFTTSTLQQEASRKLGFGTSRTMQLAQKLYEGIDLGGETVGLITYMRTDSTTLSGEAISGCRQMISQHFGDEYLPSSPRQYKTKAKNAQEAHEAVRPTDLFRHPSQVAHRLDGDMLRLYELIWKRTTASQMAAAVIDRVAVDLVSNDGQVTFRANGSVVKFDGFLKLYFEDTDDMPADAEDGDKRLPVMNEGEDAAVETITPNQHFTQPPPRYSEASLVKKMEELGIGRPSTYASILKVLQDRDYVVLDKKRFVPRDRGRLVVSFLSSFFDKYFEYGFTADLEEQLDAVSNGDVDWKKVLRDFWGQFNEIIDQTMQLSGVDVRDALDRDLGAHFFAMDENGSTETARICPNCSGGRLGLNFGRYGAFIACSNYPECRYTRQLGEEASDDDTEPYPKILGTHPETGEDVTLRKGPYGLYVQLGEQAEKEKGKKAPPKPKRASLLKGMSASDVDLALALKLLALPRDIGPHPESGELIQAGVGRYGPFLKHGTAYTSLPEEDSVLDIGMNRAMEVLATAKPKARGGSSRQLGEHPDDGKVVSQGAGRFGPYVKHGKLYASLPRDVDPATVTLDEAVRLLAEKAAKAGVKKPAAKKTSAKKASAKKGRAKKSKAKKAAARKPSGSTEQRFDAAD